MADEADQNISNAEEKSPAAASTPTPKRKKKVSAKKSISKKALGNQPKTAATSEPAEADRKTRRTTPFPITSFEEALLIPNAIQKHAAGQQVRRLTLFDQLGKSPDSGPSLQLISNANKYALIKGNYTSEHLELTSEGRIATASEDVSPKERLLTRFILAIERIAPFKSLVRSIEGKSCSSIICS